MQPSSEPRRLLVFCDGTWCGPETGTRTNIQILAEMVDIDVTGGKLEVDSKERNLKARYFYGIGLGSTFISYLFNGSTANDISTMCVETYRWIAENFEEGTEVWMFGLSRGAYTVRCVSGMINNCGVVRRPFGSSMCDEVYRIYSSPYDEDKPDSTQSQIFRAQASWPDTIPIKFLGLFDTVGSIGIPTIDAGNGPSYPTLWDQVVPSVVQTVYHACSLHDRLSVFQPCLTKLSEKEEKTRQRPQITEQWFPGCHYDLGRQKFKFLRQRVHGLEAWLSVIPNALSKTLEPNEVLSDLVLSWMLQSIKKTFPLQHAIEDIDTEISALDISIAKVDKGVGSGDVYSKPLAYAPFGLLLSAFNTPAVLSDTARVLLALRDRRIPDDKAIVYPYHKPYGEQRTSIEKLAKLTPERYPSKTFSAFKEWQKYFGVASKQDRTNGFA
ncbi:hypothetical protein AAFC00_002156 [Neodothiora populina]|uniref:T6SS Phospholipase effector Tle1-like catalytic domain-containing protein n=1 Tax=Neodothiora populina TaxID=2781224 RepID=A0ABR3PHM7_9PEZI